MKSLMDFKGEEAIVVCGKIIKPIGEIVKDTELMEAMQSDPLTAIGDAMLKHGDAVLAIVKAVCEDFDASNVGVYFMQIFTEYFKSFGESDFFKSLATTK